MGREQMAHGWSAGGGAGGGGGGYNGAMVERAYNLAIECSGREGAVALGRGDQLLAVAKIESTRRHGVALMPTVAKLCQAHGVGAEDLVEVYVSLGPGSFTGLRVALSTVKMLAMVRDVRVVGVESLDVVAQHAAGRGERAAVCLNLKRGTVYSGVFTADQAGLLRLGGEAKLRTIEDLLAEAGRPVTLVAEVLPEDVAEINKAGVTVLSGKAAQADVRALWRLGRQRAKRGAFDDAAALSPAYVREPEAVTLWNERHGG